MSLSVSNYIVSKMRKTRVFVESGLSLKETVVLENEVAHHLLHVLKRREGDIVHAFDGKGGYFEAEIDEKNKKSVSLFPDQYIEENTVSSLNLTLV